MLVSLREPTRDCVDRAHPNPRLGRNDCNLPYHMLTNVMSRRSVPEGSDLLRFFNAFQLRMSDYRNLMRLHKSGHGTLDARQVIPVPPTNPQLPNATNRQILK